MNLLPMRLAPLIKAVLLQQKTKFIEFMPRESQPQLHVSSNLARTISPNAECSISILAWFLRL